MTALFDDIARQNFINGIYRTDIDIKNISIRDTTVKEISKKVAREYIALFHYSQTMPDSTLYCYGLFYNDIIIGVICYGMGCGKNQYTAVIPDIQNGEYIELTRLWCSDRTPKNAESYFISKTLKLLPETIKLVISFSDELYHHCGIIYQATNFYYLGKNNGGKMLLMPSGVKKHPRLLGIYRMRHPNLRDKTNEELLNMLGWQVCEGGAKHRYVYLRGDRKTRKKMYSIIKDKIQPYPKIDIKKPNMEEDTKISELIKKQGYIQTNIWDFI